MAQIHRSPIGRGITLRLLLFRIKRSLRKKLKGRMVLLLPMPAGTRAAASGRGSSNGSSIESAQNYTLKMTLQPAEHSPIARPSR